MSGHHGHGAVRAAVYDRVSRSQHYRDHLAGLTAHQRHQALLAQLPGGLGQQLATGAAAGAADLSSTVTDEDVLRQHHRFLRGPEDDTGEGAASWGARLARRYYDRLFKEYAIADLSRFAESKIGLRWRTRAEVVSGKGQLGCGAKGCSAAAGLASYEVNFAYNEAGQPKQALVKLRLCPDCAAKLNHGREKQYRRVEQQQPAAVQGRGRSRERSSRRDRRKQRRRRSRSRSHSRSGDSSSDSRSDSDARQQRRRARSSSGGGRAEAPMSDADIEAWLDRMFE